MKKYAIIGAGPSGLAAAKNLKEHGIPFVGFETAPEVGGLWNIKNPNSTVYNSAHLISSKTTTQFTDFPMKESVADYPNHEELNSYFNDFAEHYQLKQHYKFNCTVKKLSRENKDWRIELEDGSSELYRGVIIANGILSHPNKPNFRGKFSGEFLHSADYKSAAIFEGKRVLIIGAGNSGCDIAVDAVHRAKSVDLSMRRGYHFVPKYVFGKPADTIGGAIKLPKKIKQKVDSVLLKWFTGDPLELGFPKPDHKLYESHPVVNSLVIYHAGHGDIKVRGDIDSFEGKTVKYKDGSETDYDLVLTATGYKLYYPFIDHEELNWKKNKPSLYLNIFHPKYNNLFVLGMVEAAGIGWQGRHDQAELVSKFIKAQEDAPEDAHSFIRKKINCEEDLTGGYNYIKLDRMAFYVHKDTYVKKMQEHIKAFDSIKKLSK